MTNPEDPSRFVGHSENPDFKPAQPSVRIASTTGLVTVRWVPSVDDVPAGLWAAAFPPAVEGVWWYRTLERSGLQDQFQFYYAVIDRDGVAVGIAPAFVMDVPLDVIAPEKLAAAVRLAGKFFRPLRYQRTFFVGSPCSDEGTIGLVPGVLMTEVLGPLHDAVREKSRSVRASMTVWKDFPDERRTDLQDLVRLGNFFEVASFPGTRIKLAGSFDLYLASLKSSHRNKLKKKLRVGPAAVPAVVEVINCPTAGQLDEMLPLFWQTYQKGKTKFEKLNRTFFELIAAESASVWILLRAAGDGKLVGFMLCIDCGPVLINKFIGLDYGRSEGFLYFQLWAAAVDWATGRGFAEIQSGQTGYGAKLEIGNELVRLTNFARHRNPIVNRLFAWQAKSISWSTIDSDLKNFVISRKTV